MDVLTSICGILSFSYVEIFAVGVLVCALISSRILKILTALRLLPTISPTEQAAIEAGSVWIDADLFSGRPDFKRLNSEPYPDLAEEERAFLNGPVEGACRLRAEAARDRAIRVDAFTPEEYLPFPVESAQRQPGADVPSEERNPCKA